MIFKWNKLSRFNFSLEINVFKGVWVSAQAALLRGDPAWGLKLVGTELSERSGEGFCWREL